MKHSTAGSGDDTIHGDDATTRSWCSGNDPITATTATTPSRGSGDNYIHGGAEIRQPRRLIRNDSIYRHGNDKIVGCTVKPTSTRRWQRHHTGGANADTIYAMTARQASMWHRQTTLSMAARQHKLTGDR